MNPLAPWILALLVHAGTVAGLPAELLPAMAYVESRGHIHVKPSPCGAAGLMQLTPAISRAYRADPMRPGSAARAAAKYLRALEARTGSLPSAIASYGAGPGRRDTPAGQRYLRRVLRAMRLFAGVRGYPGVPRAPLWRPGEEFAQKGITS